MKKILVFIIAGAISSAFAQSYTVREVTAGGFINGTSGNLIGGYQGSPTHAKLWSGNRPIDIHPSGFAYSAIVAMSGGYAAGYADRSAVVWQLDPDKSTATAARGTAVKTTAVAHVLPVPFAFYSARVNSTDGVEAGGQAYEGDDERGIGNVHAILWNLQSGTAIDLDTNAIVSGVGGGQQAGYKFGSNGATAGFWQGTSNSYVDLDPNTTDVSAATATDGTTQVGYVGLDVRVRHEGKPHDIRFFSAVYWNGDASTMQYLPSNYRHSFALTIAGDTIAGYGNTTDVIGHPIYSRAEAWVGAIRQNIDLHALLPANMISSRATSVDAFGNIVGYSVDTAGVVHSYIWTRN